LIEHRASRSTEALARFTTAGAIVDRFCNVAHEAVSLKLLLWYRTEAASRVLAAMPARRRMQVSTEGVGLAPLTDDHEECGIGRHWFHGLGSAKAEDREVAAEAFDRIAATLGPEGGTT
jgi:hypothetical protein